MALDKYCPNCDSPMKVERRPYSLHGFYLGRFDFYVCTVCQRVYHPQRTSIAIEEAAKSAGLWGLRAQPKEAEPILQFEVTSVFGQPVPAFELESPMVDHFSLADNEGEPRPAPVPVIKQTYRQPFKAEINRAPPLKAVR